MAVSISFCGIDVKCDTVDEAAALIHKLRGRISEQKSSTSHEPSEPKETGVAAFWSLLDDQQRKFIQEVAAAHPQAIEASVLAGRLGLDINRVGWVRRRMKRLAIEKKLDLGSLVSPTKVDVNGLLKTAYKAKDRLKNELASFPSSAT